jgi:hypothetical protein
MGAHIPEYSESDFERVLVREFPGAATEEARAVLLRYGKESYHSWPLRVHMACMKLADGNLDNLRKYVKAACGDPRDVLAWGEYGHSWSASGKEEQQAARTQDWEELQEWLARE